MKRSIAVEVRVNNATLILYDYSEPYIWYTTTPSDSAHKGRSVFIKNRIEHERLTDRILSEWMKTFRKRRK